MADRSGILRLRAEAFPEDEREKSEPRFWDWEFGQQGTRIFLAEEHGQCVAHLALIPQTYMVDGRPVRSALAVDAMTHPDHRGGGVYTSVVAHAVDNSIEETPLLTAYQIRPQVLGSMLRTGWQIRASLPVLLRPASVRAVFRSPRPSTEGTFETQSPAAAEVRVLSEADLPEMAAVARSMFESQRGDGIYLDRSEAFLRWRFFSNPFRRFRVTAIVSQSRMLAYLIARQTRLRGMDTVAIADFACAGGFRDAGRRLLREVIAASRRSEARLVATLLSYQHPALGSFLRCGFVPGPHRFRLLTRTRDRTLQEKISGNRWGVSWADTDHL